MIRAIVAVDKQWNIGYEGQLLAHLPGDLRYFKKQTTGSTVVMGRKTFESLPGQKPLAGRTNIVLSKDPEGFLLKHGKKDGLIVTSTLSKDLTGDIFVIGGGQIYDLLLPLCQEALVTKIDELFTADTRFPDLDKSREWTLMWESEAQKENGVKYVFTRYRRNSIRT